MAVADNNNINNNVGGDGIPASIYTTAAYTPLEFPSEKLPPSVLSLMIFQIDWL